MISIIPLFPALENLLAIGDAVVQQYRGKIREEAPQCVLHQTYAAMEQELAPVLPEYTEREIQPLVIAYSGRKESAEEAIARGLYTGVLASVLTQRNFQKNRRTHVSVSGSEKAFPYLFFFARTLDELTVENFRGERAVASAAANGGTARAITLANITGDCAGQGIASLGGRADTVTIACVNGNNVGLYIARVSGSVETLTLAGITGDFAGAYAAVQYGRVKTFTLFGINGRGAGQYAGWNNGVIDMLFSIKNKGIQHLYDSHARRTIREVNELAPDSRVRARAFALIDRLSQPNRAPEHYASASKKLGELLRAIP